MIRRPPRSTLSSSSAASDVYKRQPTSHTDNGRKANGSSESPRHLLPHTVDRPIRRANAMPLGTQHRLLRYKSVAPAQVASSDNPRAWPKTLYLGVGGVK